MKAFSELVEYISKLINVPADNPDKARRARLLNTLLLGELLILILTGLLVIADALFLKSLQGQDRQTIAIIDVVMLAGTILIYLLNRRSNAWASFIFLLFLMVAVG